MHGFSAEDGVTGLKTVARKGRDQLHGGVGSGGRGYG